MPTDVLSTTGPTPMWFIQAHRLTIGMGYDAAEAGQLAVVVVSADRRVHAALVQLLRAARGYTVAPTGDVAVIDADPADQVSAAHAIATIRELTSAGVPVLALAGRASRHDAALEAGASACLDKACAPELMLSTLRRVVRDSNPAPA